MPDRAADVIMLEPPRFIADAMLGSLARKLRIFGFDTLYFKDGDDAELESLARKEERVIVTSDLALSRDAGRRGARTLLVRGKTDKARLLSIAEALGPETFAQKGRRTSSRCALCNGVLEELGKREARKTPIPARVVARHRLFFRCASCAKVYWRGKHWDRLRRLSSSLRTKPLT
ncbi:MAG: Mut7-C RNAse domain-containing protein [Thaumarchaeota archaeon]|nr:Mut7-C RNAse domain-containing protein [Nitrososphaerota archaeon]